MYRPTSKINKFWHILLYTIVCYAAIASPAWAVITVVDYTSTTSTDSTNVTTSSINSTGANLLVVIVADFDPNTIGTLSDSKSNTWTARPSCAPGGPTNAGRVTTYYATSSPTVGSGHTFSYSGTNTYPGIAVIALSGAATSSPFDQEDCNGTTGGAATTTTTGSITPGANNEILVSGIGLTLAGSASIDSSFTIPTQTAYAGNGYGIALAYKIQTTLGFENPTWTLPGSSDATANITTFKYNPVSAVVRHRPLVLQ